MGRTIQTSPTHRYRSQVIEVDTEAAASGGVCLIMAVAVITVALTSRTRNGLPTTTAHHHSSSIPKHHQKEPILWVRITRILLSCHGGTLIISHLIQKNKMTALRGGLLIDSLQPARLDRTTHQSSVSLSSLRNLRRRHPSLKYHKNSMLGCNESHRLMGCHLIERLHHLLLPSPPRQDHATSRRCRLTDLEGTALGWYPECGR